MIINLLIIKNDSILGIHYLISQILKPNPRLMKYLLSITETKAEFWYIQSQGKTRHPTFCENFARHWLGQWAVPEKA